MAQLNCCICMLPLTAKATLEIPDFDAEDFYDFDENDQGFEDYVDERFRPGSGHVLSSISASRSTNNIFFDAVSPSAAGRQELPMPVQPVAIRATSCGHLYHAECLRLWLSTLEIEGRPKVCAYCRKPLKKRTSVITIYPVSLTDTENDKKGLPEVSSSSDGVITSNSNAKDDLTFVPDHQKSNFKQYFDKQFFYTLLISTIHFVSFMNYIQNCSRNIDEEKLEEDDFIPFGAGWAIMTTLVSIISCTLDCYPVLWHIFPA